MRHAAVTIKTAAILTILICALAPTPARAQSASPTPTEEELRLQEQKRLLELQRDIEVAKKAIRDAQPQPEAEATPATATATPLAGDTTLENVKLESEMVAYRAMSEAADRISSELKREIGVTATTAPMPALAIYDAQVVKDWRLYQALFPAFEGRVKDLLNRYTRLLCTTEGIQEEVSVDFKQNFCGGSNKAVDFGGRKSVGSLIPAVLPNAFAAGTNLLKSFIDLTALFRTDTKITGNAFTVDEAALVAEVFRGLRNKYRISGPGINLYYPEMFPPRLRDAARGSDEEFSKTVTTIGALFLAKIEADDIIAKLNVEKAELGKAVKPTQDALAPLNAELARVKALSAELRNLEAAMQAEYDATIRRRLLKEIADVNAALARLQTQSALEATIKAGKAGIQKQLTRIEEIDEDIASLTDLNKRFQTFVDEFVKADATGVNALAIFIRSEDIENVMRGDHSYWLEIKSVSAGGNNRVRKNLIRYFTGAKLDHSGGVIIEYTLYDKEGNVKYSDKLSIYEGYVEPKRIRDKAKFKDAVEP